MVLDAEFGAARRVADLYALDVSAMAAAAWRAGLIYIEMVAVVLAGLTSAGASIASQSHSD